MNRKNIILTGVVILIITTIFHLESAKVSVQDAIAPELNKEGYALAPELTGITGYLNTNEGLQLKNLRGKVVLVDFWTYTCINCLRTLPHLVEWDRKYRDQGFVIIGVHTPEFEFEKKRENVQMAIEKYGIKYAVVQDNDYATWRAFRNRYWPHKYLIDAQGYIRYDHIGEGAYAETEAKIQELLAEIGKNVSERGISTIKDTTPRKPTTPELYAGYEFALPRGQNIGNERGLQAEKIVVYELPEEREDDTIYLQGLWKSNADDLEAVDDPTSIFLDFTASSVNIVADSLLDTPLEVEVFIDGNYISVEQAGADVEFAGGTAFIVVHEPRLYNAVSGEYWQYELELKTKKGFMVSALTFG